MINREILELKNEFLKELREIEIKFGKRIEDQSTILNTKSKEQEEKINLTMQKNEQLYEIILSQKVKIEKISELSTSQKKLNDMLISHEMRINKLLTENKKLSSNYDKIISDNLVVPGYIGASCTFRNLSEYIQNNINEIQKIKKEKQNEKKLNDDIKNKLDHFMKNMLNLVDNSVTRCKHYTDNKHIFLEKMLNNKLVEFSEKNMDLRTQLFTNFSKTNQIVEDFGLKFEELKNLKEIVNNEIDLKFQEIKNSVDENQKNIEKNIDEMLKYKNSLNDLIDKKIENMNKSQKNSKFNDSKIKKSENVLSPSIKTFRGTNKREELINTFNIKTNRNINNGNNIRQKAFKRNSLIDLKQNNNNLIIETKEEREIKEEKEEEKVKEEKKNSLDNDKSGDESSNKIDLINIINNNNLLNEENKNDNEKDKIEEIKVDNKNNINNEYILRQIENNKNNKQNSINDNKLFNLDMKNNNNENNNGNNAFQNKNLNSFNVNNIKTKFNQKPAIPEINSNKNEVTNNNNNTIMVKENRIKIPNILSNLKNKEKEKVNIIDFYTNNNFRKKYKQNKANYKKKIETRNNISKSTNNTFNYIQISKEKEKEKEKELKSINSDRSIFTKKNLYNTSPQFYSIETQTPNIMMKNKKKAKFPKIGFSYKIINLGSDINFKENDSEKIQQKKESSKINIDLINPLTHTYKEYQKKKNEKKYNIQVSPNEAPLKSGIFKQNFILPNFNNTTSNNSFYNKKYYKSIDYEYNNNIKKKKNSESNHSIESVKSTRIKIIVENNLK